MAELLIWNEEMFDDYKLMGRGFDPVVESARNIREFTAFASYHEKQMRDLLRAFLVNAGLI